MPGRWLASARSPARRVAVPLAVAGLLSSLLVGGLVRPAAADGAACRCSLFPSTAVPQVPEDFDYDAQQQGIEVGVAFTSDVAGWITAIRFYKGVRNVGFHDLTVWGADGVPLGRETSSGETANGWQTQYLEHPVAIAAGTEYVASYHNDFGFYSSDTGFFDQGPLDASPLHAVEGRFHYGPRQFPSDTVSGSNYWVDVVFETAVQPAVSRYSPDRNSAGAPAATAVSVTFNSKPVSSAPLELRAPDGSLVPGTFSLTPGGGETGNPGGALFQPAAPLERGVAYTASLASVTNSGGQTTASISWSFTTAAACPCGLTLPDSTPMTSSAEGSGQATVGNLFIPLVPGVVTGIRFYKDPTNTGPHDGQLWEAPGVLLADVSSTTESDSGWQTITFARPIPIAPPTRYVASYFTFGNYSLTEGLLDNHVFHYDQLTALQGMFVPGTGAFPNSQLFHTTFFFVEPLFVPNGG
jgi:hypothetical protein